MIGFGVLPEPAAGLVPSGWSGSAIVVILFRKLCFDRSQTSLVNAGQGFRVHRLPCQGREYSCCLQVTVEMPGALASTLIVDV